MIANLKGQQQEIEQEKARLEGERQDCFHKCRSVEKEVESVASKITEYKVRICVPAVRVRMCDQQLGHMHV